MPCRSYNGPYRNSPEHKGSSQRNCSRGPPCSPGLDFEDDSHSRYVSDLGRNKNLMDNAEDSEVSHLPLLFTFNFHPMMTDFLEFPMKHEKFYHHDRNRMSDFGFGLWGKIFPRFLLVQK